MLAVGYEEVVGTLLSTTAGGGGGNDVLMLLLLVFANGGGLFVFISVGGIIEGLVAGNTFPGTVVPKYLCGGSC